MIGVPAGVRILVAAKPVDFRRGADALVALVRETLGQDPFGGTLFVFRCKRADRLKIIVWDGSGLVWCGNGWSKARSSGRPSPTE
jgi:transposase